MDFATPKQEGSSIATTLEGALKQKYIKAVFATLIRNLPYNNILFSFFKEKIQQSALRYHLRKALEKSQDIESFKTNLQIRAEKANFNNATMQIIQNILKDTTQAIDEAREAAKTPTGVFTKAQEQETQQAQNKAFSASKQETQETQLTTKTPQEIKDIISKWDLSNPSKNDKLLVSQVTGDELELLQNEFNFKGNYPLAREIDSQHLAHALNRHGNEQTEASRGQIPINIDDIVNYENIIKTSHIRETQGNKIIYKKQVNGHFVVVEEVLTGKNKLEFVTMWKAKGNITTAPTPSTKGYDLDRTLSGSYDLNNLTTKDKIKQARELGLNAKEAVHYIKTNNLPQTRANTLPQGREILEAEIVETQEIPYSQKKLIEWIINKHPKLIGSNQQARLTTKELLEFIKEENLPAKEALKLIKNTPRNLPIKIDSTSKQTTQNVDSSDPKPQINKAIKDIIDSSPAKGRDMQIIGEANFTPQVVEYAHKNNKKVAIDKLSQAEAEQLGYKYPSDVRVTIDYQAINHTLNRHGAESNLVKESGQKPVDYTDIAEYRSIVKGADESLDSVDNSGNPVLVSYKQVNGHFVVVEQIKKKNNEISFKTMFKENGDYKNSQSYKDTRAKAQTLSIGYEPSANSFTKADEIIPQTPQEIIKQAKEQGIKELESNLNDTLESYKAHETATTQLKRSIFEKENELKDLIAEKEKIQQWAETIKEQGNSRALTKIAKELEKIGFATFSKHPMLDYEVSKVKKVNPRLDGEQFYDESTIINFKDLKKFIKSRDDFIKFKDKLDTLYLADSPYGNARYIHKIKDFSNTKQAGFYQAFNENNYDNIIKELIDKETSKVKNIDDDKIISLQKELEQLKEQLEKTNQSLAQSERELEQIPFLQKLFNNKPLFNDFLTLRFNTMSEKELKKEAQKALIDIDISRSYFERSLNINPIKEFGTNYAEHYHSGESAIQKLLLERNGQVSGAFYRKELGDIDLFWGDSSKGLAHILERRKQDFIEKGFSEAEAEQKALEFVKSLPDIIENGVVEKRINRAFIDTQDKRALIALDFNGVEKKWVITAYNKDDALSQAEPHSTKHNTNTSSETRASGDSDIIPQNANALQKAQMQNNSVQKPNKYQILRATSDYVSLKKEVMYAKQSLQGRKADLQQAIKENNKERIQWAKGAIANIEKKIKSSQQDLNKEIQRIKKLGISLENPLNLKTTPMPNTKMQELQAIYKNVFPSLQSIDKAINSAKTQKEKDKLHKQRQHIINKFDKQMQTLLKDFSQKRQLLMRINLTTGRQEIQELESIHFDFENPFSVYNLDKTIYRQEWGKADGNYHQTQLVEARIFFDRFEPVIRQQIKRNIIGVEDFSKGLIKDDDIFNLKTDVKNIREDIEILYNIKPLQEFGTNYAEHYHSGESAIAKLLNEKQGQVSGAFYRKELGDIDLVWGEVTGSGKEAKGYGLAKIIEKHGDEFKDIGKELDEIIQDGEVVKRVGRDEAYNIEYKGFKVGINKGFNKQGENKWIVTAFDDNVEKTAKTAPANDSTKGASLPLNSSEIIPQTPQEIIKQAKEQGKSVTETKELLQKNKELRAKPTKPKEYIKIDYHQQHYTTKDLEKLEAMLQDRQEVLKNINEKISYYKAKTDEIKARNADDEKKYNDLYFSTAEADEATREAIWQQMKAIKENNAAFLKQNQRIVDTYFGYQRKANKIESEIEFLQDKITKLEAQKVDSSVESTPPKHTQTPPTQKGLFDEVDSTEPNFTYTTGEAKGIAELRKDLKQALEPSLNKEIVNKETGIAATISTKGLTKISSSKAVAKTIQNGFTRDEHFKVAQDLKNLFENSKLKESHTNTKARDEIQGVYRFTKDLEINGSQAEAKITLFENNQAGNRIYSLELESLEKPTPLSPSATQTKAGAADLTQSVGGDANPTNIAKTDGEIIAQNNAVDTKWQEAELKNNLFENMKKFNETFNTPFEIAQKYHYIKDKIQNFEALPPTLTETKFFENYQGLVSKFLKKNLRVVPSIYDEKGELINLYKLNERVNSFSELEKFKNSLENKSYSALGILMPLKDSKTLDELKEVLTGLNTYLQKQHKKLNKDYVKNYESKKLEAQQARKELDEIETLFKIEADGTLKGYAEAMYNKLESLRNTRNAIVQEILKLDKGLASLKTLENRFNGGEFYNFLQDIISLREKADMSLYEKEKARKRIEEALNITPIKEFGTNYAEHYHSGQTAIQKLLAEAQAHKQSGAKGEYKGQVAGAFYRKELGDIDLVWGEVEGSGKEAKGYGLAKIIEKHLNAGDFKAFGEGQQGLINAINQIIQDGKVVTQNGVDSIVLRKNGEEYRVGISKGWDNVGENKWIITSYKNNKYKESAETSYHDTFTSKEPLENPVSTIIPQEK